MLTAAGLFNESAIPTSKPHTCCGVHFQHACALAQIFKAMSVVLRIFFQCCFPTSKQKRPAIIAQGRSASLSILSLWVQIRSCAWFLVSYNQVLPGDATLPILLFLVCIEAKQA